MKKFLVAMLAVALVLAFSAAARADTDSDSASVYLDAHDSMIDIYHYGGTQNPTELLNDAALGEDDFLETGRVTKWAVNAVGPYDLDVSWTCAGAGSDVGDTTLRATNALEIRLCSTDSTISSDGATWDWDFHGQDTDTATDLINGTSHAGDWRQDRFWVEYGWDLNDFDVRDPARTYTYTVTYNVGPP